MQWQRTEITIIMISWFSNPNPFMKNRKRQPRTACTNATWLQPSYRLLWSTRCCLKDSDLRHTRQLRDKPIRLNKHPKCLLTSDAETPSRRIPRKTLTRTQLEDLTKGKGEQPLAWMNNNSLTLNASPKDKRNPLILMTISAKKMLHPIIIIRKILNTTRMINHRRYPNNQIWEILYINRSNKQRSKRSRYKK